MIIHSAPKEINEIDIYKYNYSFCTLVNNLDEYHDMVSAFQAKGFGSDDCEFLYIDNSNGNKYESYGGYNIFLRRAKGKYIILCHQDILPIEDGRGHLDRLLVNLTAHDPNWGLCGNAGSADNNQIAYRISDPALGDGSKGGPFPFAVMNLDENFIIARNDANLAVSRDLSGFHWYGSDLCLVADFLGWSSYVIDFHIYHKSAGYQDKTYHQIRRDLAKKYSRAFRPRWYYAIGTQTHFPTYLSGSFIEFLKSITYKIPIISFFSLYKSRIMRGFAKLINLIVK